MAIEAVATEQERRVSRQELASETTKSVKSLTDLLSVAQDMIKEYCAEQGYQPRSESLSF